MIAIPKTGDVFYRCVETRAGMYFSNGKRINMGHFIKMCESANIRWKEYEKLITKLLTYPQYYLLEIAASKLAS